MLTRTTMRCSFDEVLCELLIKWPCRGETHKIRELLSNAYDTALASASSSMFTSSTVEAPPLRRFDLLLTVCVLTAPLLIPARQSEQTSSISCVITKQPHSTAAASKDLRHADLVLRHADLVPAARLQGLRTAASRCCCLPSRAAPVGEVAWPPLQCAGPARPRSGPGRTPLSWRLQARCTER